LKNLKWSQVYRRPDGNGYIEPELCALAGGHLNGQA
jgi:hypothetical protein